MRKKLFIMDIDGTLAVGENLISGAAELIREIRAQGGISCFFTNNSSRGVSDYQKKFKAWGIETQEREFVTAGTFAIWRMKELFGTRKIYVQGTKAFVNECIREGLQVTEREEAGIAAVLSTYDRELTYEKLAVTCKILECYDVPWYATNADLCCPCSFGMVPDCAAICTMISCTVGRSPEYLGKPDAGMAEYALKKYGCNKEETLLIGDRLYTDIACGENAGIDTCLVLSGEEKEYSAQPTFCFQSVASLAGILRQMRENQIQDFPYEIDLRENRRAENGMISAAEVVYERSTRWYKGDLHIHTTLSDGHDSAEEICLRAEKNGLDYYAVTDHNRLQNLWPLSAAMVIPGMEITLEAGHMNVFGDGPFPETVKKLAETDLISPQAKCRAQELEREVRERRIVDALVEECRASGEKKKYFLSLNHPFLSKWRWKLPELPLDILDCLEIDNNPTLEYEDGIYAAEANRKAVCLMDQLWADGHRICAVGGSDVHLKETERYGTSQKASTPGDPATWLYMETLSRREFQKAVRSCHAYVTRDCQVKFDCRLLDENREQIRGSWMFGDRLPEACRYLQYTLCLTETGSSTGQPERKLHAYVIENEKRVELAEKETEDDDGRIRRRYEGTLTLSGDGYQWIRFGAEDSEGRLAFYANPFTKGAKEPEYDCLGDIHRFTNSVTDSSQKN